MKLIVPPPPAELVPVRDLCPGDWITDDPETARYHLVQAVDLAAGRIAVGEHPDTATVLPCDPDGQVYREYRPGR